jgi:phytoene desaturase
MKKVVIIGSGFGGLAAGIRLALKGFKTIIYEKSSQPGGVAGFFESEGYKFDTGPATITAPNILNSLFLLANKNPADYFELVKLYPYYRMYFHDNTFIDYSGNEDAMRAQLGVFEPEDVDNYLKYLDFSKRMYKNLYGLGATPFQHVLKMLRYFPKAIKIKALRSYSKIASNFFDDYHSQNLFSFQPLLFGGNPYKTPSLYMLITHQERQSGVYYAKSGMYNIVKALVKLYNELGGEIVLSSEVSEILVHNRKVRGILSGHVFEDADIVVSDADAYHTYYNLIKHDYRSNWTNKKLNKSKISISAFMLFLGVNNKMPKLMPNTIILNQRFKEFMKDIFIRKNIPNNFSMYIHSPSKLNDNMAPEGCDCFYALVPAANLQNGVNWNIIKEDFADKIINFRERFWFTRT